MVDGHSHGRRYNGPVITKGSANSWPRNRGAVREAKDTYWRDRIACLGKSRRFALPTSCDAQALRRPVLA